MDERWQPAPGFDGAFRVSSLGNVMTRDFVPLPGHEVNGYRRVNLRLNGRDNSRAVHRLVLEAFVGPCPKGMIGLHNDDNRLNNNVDNLRWGTHAENIQDARKNGRGVKMSDEKVRLLRASSKKDSELARENNLSEIAVFNVRTRITYRHVL